MIPLRALLIPAAVAIIIVNMHGKARGSDCPAPQRLPHSCSEVKACVDLAGGLDNAKRLAEQQGHSKIKIATVAKICGLKG